MKRSIPMAICILLVASSTICVAQRSNDNKRSRGAMEVPDHPQEIGEAGIAWFTTWETGLAEAKRTNRPIFFMSAATTCSGVSGVF